MAGITQKRLCKEISRKRNELHRIVNGDTSLLLDKKTYLISTELDDLIVRLMKKEIKNKE